MSLKGNIPIRALLTKASRVNDASRAREAKVSITYLRSRVLYDQRLATFSGKNLLAA